MKFSRMSTSHLQMTCEVSQRALWSQTCYAPANCTPRVFLLNSVAFSNKYWLCIECTYG